MTCLLRISITAAISLAAAGGSLPGIAAIEAEPQRYHPGGDEYQAGDEALFLPSIVKFTDEKELDDLMESGGILLRRRGDMALMYLPNPDHIENAEPSLPSPDRQRRVPRIPPQPRRPRTPRITPAMDKALECYGASRVLEGEGLPSPFTGRGVVVGICDIGFDPMHPNFLDPATGKSRIRRITQYKEAQGERTDMRNPEEFKRWTTDTVAEYHATHVAGILAGSDNSCGYRGIASGADIVVSTSQLSDAGLLAGVEDILEYAREAGKPAVVNLSMGCYTGPHDGTSLFSQYLDLLGEEAIICLSSGNEGNSTNTVTFNFTEARERPGQRLHNYKWTQFDIEGMTDIWSADARPLRLTPVVYDETLTEIVYRFPTQTLTGGARWGVSTLPGAEGFDTADEDFRRYYSGWLMAEGDVNEWNGRYNVALTYELHTETLSDAGAWARYNIGFQLEGEPGQRADIFSDGITTRLRQIPGSPMPGNTISVSDLATGENLLCIGMYNSRSGCPLLNGGEYDAKAEEMTVSVNSSYGTLPDGRVLPHTVAPGNPIISSFSGPFLEAHPDWLGQCSGESLYNGESYYWVRQGGTSMSSPYVAGFIATWLEADPTLTIKDVKRIISATNRHDINAPDDPRHGKGWFDPYAGLMNVLAGASVKGATVDRLNATISISGDMLMISNPAEEELQVLLTAPDGRILSEYRSGEAEIQVPHNQSPGSLLLVTLCSRQAPPLTLKAIVSSWSN